MRWLMLVAAILVGCGEPTWEEEAWCVASKWELFGALTAPTDDVTLARQYSLVAAALQHETTDLKRRPIPDRYEADVREELKEGLDELPSFAAENVEERPLSFEAVDMVEDRFQQALEDAGIPRYTPNCDLSALEPLTGS